MDTQVVKKIEEAKENKELFDKAIDMCICPECGDKLTRTVGQF